MDIVIIWLCSYDCCGCCGACTLRFVFAAATAATAAAADAAAAAAATAAAVALWAAVEVEDIFFATSRGRLNKLVVQWV